MLLLYWSIVPFYVVSSVFNGFLLCFYYVFVIIFIIFYVNFHSLYRNRTRWSWYSDEVQWLYTCVAQPYWASKRGRWNRETWHRTTWQLGTISQGWTSRDWTTRHQITQIATGWTSVGPRKNRSCWTINELNPVCHDSTAALIVACSFCVQTAILSALIRSPYSRGSTTAATATTARTKTRTGRRLCQQHQLQGRRNRQRQLRQQPRTTVAKCASWHHVLASHWFRADIEQ